jgi:hypothetical protein
MKARLSLMMFLESFIWGGWFVFFALTFRNENVHYVKA